MSIYLEEKGLRQNAEKQPNLQELSLLELLGCHFIFMRKETRYFAKKAVPNSSLPVLFGGGCER